MIWLILGGVVLLLLVIAAAHGEPPRPRRAPPAESPHDLLTRDPAQALARYGTPADLERLIEEGHADDLRRLGWDGEGASDGGGRGEG